VLRLSTFLLENSRYDTQCVFFVGYITASFQRLDYIASDVMVIDRMGCMGWINLSQDRDQWRALSNEPLSSVQYWEILE
jgi:hypothetical protein